MTLEDAGGDEAAAAQWEDPSEGNVLSSVMEACEDGNVDALDDLLGKLSVGVDEKGEEGDTALHLACLYGERQEGICFFHVKSPFRGHRRRSLSLFFFLLFVPPHGLMKFECTELDAQRRVTSW